MRRGDFRDPLLVLIERENGTCKGCANTLIVFDKKICAKSITGKYGRRCSAYAEAAIPRDPASIAAQA